MMTKIHVCIDFFQTFSYKKLSSFKHLINYQEMTYDTEMQNTQQGVGVTISLPKQVNFSLHLTLFSIGHALARIPGLSLNLSTCFQLSCHISYLEHINRDLLLKLKSGKMKWV